MRDRTSQPDPGTAPKKRKSRVISISVRGQEVWSERAPVTPDEVCARVSAALDLHSREGMRQGYRPQTPSTPKPPQKP